MISRWRRMAQAVLVCVVMVTELVPAFSHTPVAIVAILSRDVAPYREALRGFEEVIKASGRAYKITDIAMDTMKVDTEGLIGKIRDRKPDLILTVGSTATRTVADGIRDIPIVFSLVLPSSGNGTLEGLMQSQGNITGASMEIPYATQFAKIGEVLPAVKRIGVLYDPQITGPIVDTAAEAARAMGFDLVSIPVSSESDVITGTETLAGQVDAIWSVADSTVFSPQGLRQMLLVTLRKRIPFVGLSPSFVKAGALLAFSVDYEDVGRQSGEAATRILSGEAPSRVQMTVPRSVSLSVNMNTARQIQVRIQDNIKNKASLYF